MKSIGRNCVALLLALVSVAVAKASTVDTLAVESKAMNKKVDVTVVMPDNVEKGQKLPSHPLFCSLLYSQRQAYQPYLPLRVKQ